MLLWPWHEGQGEIRQKLTSFRQVCALGIQVLLECLRTRFVDGGQSLQIGVYVVDAEINVELKLQSLGTVIRIDKVLANLLEKFLPGALIEHLQNVILVGFVSRWRLGELHLRFQIGAFVLESLKGSEVAGCLEVLLDHGQQLIVLAFKFGIGLVLAVYCPNGTLLDDADVLLGVAYIGCVGLRWFLVHRLLLIF